MRSSVSAILSDPVPDTTMSFPDYQQSSADHARLLVVCQHIGHQLEPDTFTRVVEVISRVGEVQVTDKTGAVRNIRVRYTDRYPTENNEWGEFQAHRRVLGVVTVGACHSQIELSELCRLHETCRAKYGSTVYDTRCVVFCLPSKSDELSDTEEEVTVNGDNGDVLDDKSDPIESKDPDKPPSWFQSHQNYKTRLLQYYGSNYQTGLAADIQDFVASLFWILESKRVEASRDTSEKIPLLCAPFERKDFVGLDMESRNNRKRVLGRLKKHLGDVSLQAGLMAEAWNYYQVAADVLRPANDWLWLAASLEGLCAVSVVLQEQQERGLTIGARGLGEAEIVEKYREAVIHYGKYKHAGIIETEASIKAVLVLIKQGNFLLAAEFLQNIVFINLQMNDAEKIARFLALADLYHQIGFSRKYAFFKRVAAMRCVAPQNPHHDWGACYRLMLAAVGGYSIDLTLPGPPSLGWPALQVQLLQELVGTSRKMGAHAASTRHMTFLLENMKLSPSERQDFAAQLSVLAVRAGSSPVPLVTEDGAVLQPVNLFSIPRVSKFKPVQLAPHFTPFPRRAVADQSGPFLFTPITSFGGGSARSSGRLKQRQHVTWVAGDVGEVALELTNPLNVDLKVSNFSLLFEGLNFESHPSQLNLSPLSSKTTVHLQGVPKEAGTLRILGYTHTVLGVKSVCHLKDFDHSEEECTIQVIPPLPQVCVTNELKSDSSEWGPVPDMLSLYAGQTVEMRLTISNTGREAVGQITVDVGLEQAGQVSPFVQLDTASLAAALPLEPGGKVEVAVKVTGVVDSGGLQPSLRPEDSVSVAGSEGGRWSLPSRSLNTTGHPSLVSQASHGSGAGGGETQAVSLKVEYSGVGGEEVAWSRRAVQQVNLVQLPSLQVSRWDVLPGDTQHNCFLVLDLVNRTSQEMELGYTERKKILIEAGDMCRVPVPVTKCSFSESLDWTSQGVGGVTEYLADCVSLRWSIMEQDGVRTGVSGLESILWTETMMDLLRRPPLVAEVKVGGVLVGEGGEVEARIGEVVVVEVSLANQLLEPVCDCSLSVRLQQDCLGAGRLGSAGAAMAGTPGGGGASLIREVEPGGVVGHTTQLLPLCPGQFRLIVSAKVIFRDKAHSWRLAPVSVTVTA